MARYSVAALLLAVSLAACRERGPTQAIPPEEGTHPTLGEVSAALPLGGRPHGVAVAGNGIFYISQIDGHTVTKGSVSSDGQSITGSIAVGNSPAHVAINRAGTFAYTANQFGNSATAINVEANTVVGNVPLTDGGFNLLVSPNGSRLYVTTASGNLHVVRTSDLSVITTISVGPAANGLAYDAIDNVLYVSALHGQRVTAIAEQDNSVLRTYTVSDMPQRIALSRDRSRLYIASESVGLEVLDLATGARTAVASIPPGAVGLALSPDGEQLYITNPPAGTLHIVRTSDLSLVKSLTDLAQPRNVAFGAGGTTAIVTGELGLVYFIR